MIKLAMIEDVKHVTDLALLLWPNHAYDEMEKEMQALLCDDDAAIFLAYTKEVFAGFAQCQLRYDYVEGTSFSPVGYLEGLYVENDFRKLGIAKKLVHACENWAKEKGCQEFASDCELHNAESLAVHLKLGFKEVNRVICFTKAL